MLPYWLLYALAAVPALTDRSQVRERHSIIWPTLLGLVIALAIGLRYKVGVDWSSYIHIFEDISYVDLFASMSRTDPSFGIINWIVAQADWGYWVVNLACGALFTWGLFTFCFRLPNPWLGIAVATPYLILVVAMGYSRQGVAVGCTMLGLAALSRHSLAKALFWVFVAASFHKSAIVVIPIVALAYTRNRLVVIGMSTVLAVAAYYFFVASQLQILVSRYGETSSFESQGTLLRMAMNLTPALLYLGTMRRFPISDFQRAMWRNFALLAILSFPLFFLLPSSTPLDRLALYIIPLQIFMLSWLPNIFKADGGPNRQLVVVVLVYSAIVQFVWLNFASHSYAWDPYRIYPIFQWQDNYGERPA